MRIIVISPQAPIFTKSLSDDIKLRQEYLMRFASPKTQIEIVPADLEPDWVEKAIKGEKAGFDAIAIHSGSNIALEAIRGAVAIPVVSGAEAMLHMACLIANKIGVVTANDVAASELVKRWSSINIDHSCITSIRFVDISYKDSVQRKNELWDQFIGLGKQQVNEEGAQVIVPACLNWMPTFELFITPNAKEQIEEILSVPVIHPSALLVKFAETMASIKIAHSKKAYPYRLTSP